MASAVECCKKVLALSMMLCVVVPAVVVVECFGGDIAGDADIDQPRSTAAAVCVCADRASMVADSRLQ